MSDPRVAAMALIGAAITQNTSIEDALRCLDKPIPEEAVDWAIRHLPPLRIVQGHVYVHMISQPVRATWQEDAAISASLPPRCRTDYPATMCPCGAVRMRWVA